MSAKDEPTAGPRLPHPAIAWDAAGVPRAEAFADGYFDRRDPIGERSYVFLEGCGLPDAWVGRRRFTVGETGFGTGLTVLLLLDLWRATADRRPADARLDILSIEGFPLAPEDLTRAHAALPERLAADAGALRRQWPPPYRGRHRLSFPDAGATLTLILDDVAPALEDLAASAEGPIDAWFLDGFAPARNPAMWEVDAIRRAVSLTADGGRIATFTAAGAVRRALAEAGAEVTRRPGFAGKRHCLAAHLPVGEPPARMKTTPCHPCPRTPWMRRQAPLPAGSPVLVVGGGVAAHATTWALAEAGLAVTRLGPTAHPPAALIAPKLVRGDTAYARLSALSYLDALRRFEGIATAAPDLWLGRGVVEPSRDGDTARQAALVEALGWPGALLRRETDGLHHPRAGVIDPAVLLAHLAREAAAHGARTVDAPVISLARIDGGWRALDAAGAPLAEGVAAVVAAGPESFSLLPESAAWSAARHAGGRLFHVDRSPLTRAATYGGFLTQPLGPGPDMEPDARAILGASARAAGAPAAARAEEEGKRADSWNLVLGRLAGALPTAARLLEARYSDALPESWVGVRTTTPDHLPLAGPVPDDAAYRAAFRDWARGARGVPDSVSGDAPTDVPGLFVLAGLGARGYQLAPLLADHLAAWLAGGPSPIGGTDAAAVHPGRVLIRAMARGIPVAAPDATRPAATDGPPVAPTRLDGA